MRVYSHVNIDSTLNIINDALDRTVVFIEQTFSDWSCISKICIINVLYNYNTYV